MLAYTELASVIVMQRTQENGAEAIPGNQHPRLQNWQGTIDLGSFVYRRGVGVRDCIFLLADKNMEAAFIGFLTSLIRIQECIIR